MKGKGRSGWFKGRRFTSEAIPWALQRCLAFLNSYHDPSSMLADPGVDVGHAPLFRWVQAHAPTLERRIRRHLRPRDRSWRVDGTYIKVRGVWTCPCRAVDSLGQAIDLLLSARRDASAARPFFRKALRRPHTVNPRTITAGKNAACPSAAKRLKRAGQPWRFSRLRQCKHLNNVVEQGHPRVKRLVRPGLGFGSPRTARRTLAGHGAMAMARKGQARSVGGRDMKAQAAFVAGLFGMAA